MIDLTAFQQNCVLVIASSERQHGDIPHGLAVKEALEQIYGKEVNHGRLYPNLDALVDRGLVEKTERDKRTNAYSLTQKGAEAINDLQYFVRHAQGKDVANPYGSEDTQASTAPADD
ncbi:PadR family transcriptional regulator [Natronosalvus rutilus]|uniref:PadR family transcriptional regulator n=1 Tax=Natronosalvus rutilus TaxID=2953753 RepID=A0A9E7NFF2_9EURY|nr:helix-turn-helix transcriptional regulator [Natronosalvus rutilus]UTF56015.1 PadR family transcriptional regulator [Natronosalvus rutilus]